MKSILSLDGPWRMAGFEEGQGNWALPDSLLPVGVSEVVGHVPGEVHVDLLRAGLIPDPYYGTNAEALQWVGGKEWWYKRTFDVEEDFLLTRTFLEFDGLDTQATIFLNGREAGRAHNMLIAHRFDVTELMHEGRNTVAVRFEPSARKGFCSEPQLVGAGIWRDARLASYDALSISCVHIDPELSGTFADVWVTIEAENYTTEDQKVVASVVLALGDNRETIEVIDEVSPFGGVIEAVIRIEEPQLWWPNGFGEQTLYTCMVGLAVEGAVQDVAEAKFGLRTMAIVERDEQDGSRFTMMVNGEEVFCKGGNWIPADHFVSNVTPERYRDLVRLAKDANFNMLRVGDGGVYPGQAFYDACDEMGIMIWQDFMFGRATYTDSDDSRREVAQEAESVVKRLRNHPSVMVWCGSGECEATGPLFNEVIPNVLKRLDHSRPYKPCSPFGDATDGDWPQAAQGDHTKWLEAVEAERPLFASRLLAQGPPEIESLRDFIPEDKLWAPTNDVWECHGTDKALVDITRRAMGDFDKADQFAAYAGILQGEFIKAAVEHYRREKWSVSGALLHTYDDCWPAISGSVVDYYARPKTAYYYARRAFAPVIVSFKQIEDRVQLYVTSDDRLADVIGFLHVGVFTFGACGFDTQEVPVALRANTSRAFWESEPIEQLLTDPTRQCLVATLTQRGKLVTKAVYFARPFGEVEFPNPKLLMHREQIDERRHKMILAADAYARNVAFADLPAHARPSDNYFDLLPGEEHAVVIDNLSVDEANELKVNVWRL